MVSEAGRDSPSQPVHETLTLLLLRAGEGRANPLLQVEAPCGPQLKISLRRLWPAILPTSGDKAEVGWGAGTSQPLVTLPSMDRASHGRGSMGGHLETPSPPGAHHGPLQQPRTQVPDSTHHG